MKKKVYGKLVTNKETTKESDVVIQLEEKYTLDDQYQFMHLNMDELIRSRSLHFENLAKTLQENYDLSPVPDFSTNKHDPVHLVGTISFNSESKVGDDNIVLQIGHEHRFLDISEIKKCNLFSGQVVGIEGICRTSTRIQVLKIFDDISAPRRNIKDTTLRNKRVNIAIANGPFLDHKLKPSDGFSEFLKKSTDRYVDAIILLGPFIPENYSELLVTSKSFSNLFDEFCGKIEEILVNDSTKVILIPSLLDAHHHNILPQHRFKKELNNLVMLPNPCIFLINDISFAVSSYDSLKEIQSCSVNKSNEISRSNNSDLFKGVIQQRNFIPQYPTKANIDYKRYNTNLDLEYTPDVLIFNSGLKEMVENVNNVVCVSAGQFLKEGKGGNFCELLINETIENSDHITNRVNSNFVRIN